MATKTFEELKQLAIQIRDEKTNKQNTATRIGTQMLEHLDKLEQDYYDKTATDEELKERDEKLTELEKNIGGMVNESIDNIEYIRAYVDSEGKFLWGIKADGSIEWEKGIPTPVKNALIELEKKINEESITELSFAIDVINASLKPITETFGYNENVEFINIITDSEGKILFGIMTDGKPYFPKNEMYKVINNDEYLAAWVDDTDRILFGIKSDGSVYVAKSDFIDTINNIKNLLLVSAINSLSYINDEEYIHVVTDSNNRILEAIRRDGKKIYPKQELLEKYEDIEGRTEMTLDRDGRILSYRDNKGVKHEEKLDVTEFSQNGKSITVASIEDLKNVQISPSDINIDELDGVSNHNTPNLLIPSEMEKTFNDGTNSFTPPNEGYEMSNRIECEAGDWFTRTGTATGMVVVTDVNDKNGTRLFNQDGTTLGNTFKVPEDLTWVKHIRMAVEVGGANDGSVVICKGKEAFIGDDRGDFLTIKKLKVEKRNVSNDILYIKSEDGTKFYELYVDAEGVIRTKEVDPELIPESEYPDNWYAMTLRGSFEGYFDRMLLLNKMGIVVLKADGPVKIKELPVEENTAGWGELNHYYTASGEDRYVYINKNVYLYDAELNKIDIGDLKCDNHDVIYLSDDHFICFLSRNANINVPGDDEKRIISGARIEEYKKIDGEWKIIGEFNVVDYPQLCTDAYGDLGGSFANVTDSHYNTIDLDYDGNLLLNLRNWDTWIKIRRVENPNGTVTIGSETLNYEEAIIGRVGGRHNSAYIDSKRVLNEGFKFTDVPTSLIEVSEDAWEEWQWFHSHDVKYWGMKEINGKKYPTYTIFDNNYWTGKTFVEEQYNVLNKNNNVLINPQGSGNYYLPEKEGNEGYEEHTHSRVIQISIDWDNHKVMDYKIYYIPKMYSREQCGCTMYDEGIISIAYSYTKTFGLWDFTTESTEVSGKVYKGAKELFVGKYDNYNFCYRANTYKVNK